MQINETNAKEVKIKPLAPSAASAVGRVLKQQKSKHWDSDAHRAGIKYLAQSFAANADGTGAVDWNGFQSALGSEPWDYASNMKKRIAAAGLIATEEEKASQYE